MEQAILKILELLEEKTISTDDAERLIKALNTDNETKPTSDTKNQTDEVIDPEITVNNTKKTPPKIKPKVGVIMMDKSGNIIQQGEAPVIEENGARPYQKDRDAGMVFPETEKKSKKQDD